MFYLRVSALFFWSFFCFFIGAIATLFQKSGKPDWNTRIGHLLGWGGLKIAGIKIEIEGIDRLSSCQPCVYIANHQSAFDAIIFTTLFPHHTLIIGKRELLWIPFFGLLFKRAGNILINRKHRGNSKAGLEQAIQKIGKGKKSIWIFPEGTRNHSSLPLLPFKKGAFYIALAAGVPILPIVAAPLKPLLCWEQKRIKSGVLRLKILAPLFTTEFKREEVNRLSDTARGQMLIAFEELKMKVGN